MALNISVLFSRMRYVAAYLLAVLGGNESPTSKDLKKILDSVGIETDDERLNKVVVPSGFRAYVPVGVEHWSCSLVFSVSLFPLLLAWYYFSLIIYICDFQNAAEPIATILYSIFIEVWLHLCQLLLPSDLNPKNSKDNGMMITDNIYCK